MSNGIPTSIESDWVDQQRQTDLVIVASVLTFISGLIVVLRCIGRFYLTRNASIDDCFIIMAMLLTIGYTVNLGVTGKAVHLGYPVALLSLDQLVAFMKMTLAIQVMYYINIFCIKASILFTYLRFAITYRFRMLCFVTIGVHSAFLLVCLIITLAQCQPLEKMWDFVGAVDGRCINTTAFFYFSSGFNIITDIWILALPIKTLMSIDRPTSEKIGLLFVFGAGAFACIASIVRLHTIYTYTLSTDPTHDGILVNLWSVIEVTIAISCASVPALKPVFSREQRRRTREAGKTKSGSGSHPNGVRLGSKGSNHHGIKGGDNTSRDISNGRRMTESDERYSLDNMPTPCPPTAPLPPLTHQASHTTMGTTPEIDPWEEMPNDNGGAFIFTPLGSPDKRMSRPIPSPESDDCRNSSAMPFQGL